jgi:hypothetical protein
MESTILCDKKPCRLLKSNRHFGGTYRLHLQSRVRGARYQRQSSGKSRRYDPLKRRLIFNRLHSIMSQKTTASKLFVSECTAPPCSDYKITSRTTVSSMYRIARSFTTHTHTHTHIYIYIYIYIKLNSMVWVHERTIPTERPPLVGEVIANLCG